MARTTWMLHLSRFETKDKAERADQKIADIHNKAPKKTKLEQLAKDTSKSHPKGTNPRKKSSKYDQKRTSTRVARFCQLCKDADMPYAEYSSHATKDCTNNGKYQSYMSGNAASRDEGKNKYKKEYKKLNKTRKKVLAQLKSFKKKYKSANSVKEFKKFGKKLPKGGDSSSDSSVDFSSSSDSSDDSNSSAGSFWGKNIQHGGEKGNHRMDNLINKDLREHINLNKGLVNDIRSHESKTRPENNQPTSVTYLNVRGGEQGR